MNVRRDKVDKIPKVGDKIAYNPPYYKGLEISTIEGFSKSGLPILGVDKFGSNITPKTGFVIIESVPEDFSNVAREVIILSKDEAKDIAWGDSFDFEVISQEVVDTRRWVTCHEIIVSRNSDGKIFKSYYEQGATEMQDQLPYEYDEPKFREVFKTEETIIVFK